MKVKVRAGLVAALTHGLTPGNVYRVIGIEADSYRIMNDVGLACLYEPRAFVIVDATPERGWTTDYGASGERYSYPPVLSQPGFFEDVHAFDTAALVALQTYLESLAAGTAARASDSWRRARLAARRRHRMRCGRVARHRRRVGSRSRG